VPNPHYSLTTHHAHGAWSARKNQFEDNLTFAAAPLAVYLSVVYAFSFSHDSSSARQSGNLAILSLDGLLLVYLRRAFTLSGSSSGNARYSTVGVALAVSVVLLHADYLLSRYRGGEYGFSGSLTAIKTYVMMCQVCAIFALSLGRSATWRLKLGAPDLMLFSVVLVPLANYFLRNRDSFSNLAAVEYFVLFTAIPLVALVFVQALQRNLGSAISAVPLVVGLTLVHYLMPVVSAVLRRPIEALFLVQLGFAVVASSCLAMLYAAHRKTLGYAAVVFSAFGVVVSLASPKVAGPELARAARPVASGLEPVPSQYVGRPLRKKPDVFLLVYDGYAASTMLNRYGIDNEHQSAYLAKKGFVTYERAYSVYLSSRSSMSAVMSMGSPPDVGIGGPTMATRFFQHHGYRVSLVLNSHLLKDEGPVSADFTFPALTYRSDLDALYRGIAGGEFKSENVFLDSDRDRWISVKRAKLSQRATEPQVVYAHSGFPGHSQNSGACLDDEVKRYSTRLATANKEMVDDIETILATGRDSIVIVAGDHGPYLTGDCLYLHGYASEDITAEHLADRYATMLAVRWPDDNYGEFDRILRIQDVFRSVSAYLLGDTSILDDRLPTLSFGFGGIPDGAVRDGIVAIGKDRGKPLLP
jgi:hypothetical protein